MLDVEALFSGQRPANIAPLPKSMFYSLKVIWGDWLMALNTSLSNTDNIVKILSDRSVYKAVLFDNININLSFYILKDTGRIRRLGGSP